jgi:hypothetical protein
MKKVVFMAYPKRSHEAGRRSESHTLRDPPEGGEFVVNVTSADAVSLLNDVSTKPTVTTKVYFKPASSALGASANCMKTEPGDFMSRYGRVPSTT